MQPPPAALTAPPPLSFMPAALASAEGGQLGCPTNRAAQVGGLGRHAPPISRVGAGRGVMHFGRRALLGRAAIQPSAQLSGRVCVVVAPQQREWTTPWYLLLLRGVWILVVNRDKLGLEYLTI